METEPTYPRASVSIGLLMWLLAFSVWRLLSLGVSGVSLEDGLWYSELVCAATTVAVFAYLAARPPARTQLIGWGLGGAVVALVFALWGPMSPRQQVAMNLALLSATFCVGGLFGEVVDSPAYVVPIFFAAAVDTSVRTWAGRWLLGSAVQSARPALGFPVVGGSELAPAFAASDLVFLAVFLRALERLGMGLSRGDFAAIAAVVVFCSASGIGVLAPVRPALMVGCVLALRWRRLKAAPDSVGPAIGFGLTLACVLALLTCAGGVGQRFWHR